MKKKYETLFEGAIYAVSRMGSAGLMVFAAWYSIHNESPINAGWVSSLIIIPSIASVIDGGLALGLLSLAAKKPHMYSYYRRPLIIFSLLWALVCVAVYYMGVYNFSGCATGGEGKYCSLVNESGHNYFYVAAALVVSIVGAACQRGLIALGHTRRQAVTCSLMLLLVFFISVYFRFNAAVAVLLTIFSLSIADICLLFFLKSKKNDVQVEISFLEFVKILAASALFFGLLQIVPLSAYLYDVDILKNVQSSDYIAAYGLTQRVTLLILTAYSLIILPQWRQQGEKLAMNRVDIKRRVDKFVRRACVVSIVFSASFLFLFVLVEYIFPGLLFKSGTSFALKFGFSFQIFVGVLSSTVGINFAFSRSRRYIFLFVIVLVPLLLFSKIYLAELHPDFFPLISSVLVLFLSVAPQYFISIRS